MTCCAVMPRDTGRSDSRWGSFTGVPITLRSSMVSRASRPAQMVMKNWRRRCRVQCAGASELEHAKATLRGRPHDIAVYNGWIEASRIVAFVSLEAIANAAETEKRLSIAVG
jgi:hypothetical protein